MRKRIYIAGPISKGDRAHNLKQATDAARTLIDLGFAPLCPHLTMHLEWAFEVDHPTWIEVDLAWLSQADAALRLPGESLGADAEESFALESGIPVFTTIEELLKWI